MNKSVKKIQLVFENCEEINIDMEFIGFFYIGELKTGIERVASNAVEKITTAYEVRIQIKKEYNENKYKPFGLDGMEAVAPFDRIIEYNDINAINVIYEDNSEEYYYVDYISETEEIGSLNINQKQIVLDTGDLLFGIKKGISEEELKEMKEFML